MKEESGIRSYGNDPSNTELRYWGVGKGRTKMETRGQMVKCFQKAAC